MSSIPKNKKRNIVLLIVFTALFVLAFSCFLMSNNNKIKQNDFANVVKNKNIITNALISNEVTNNKKNKKYKQISLNTFKFEVPNNMKGSVNKSTYTGTAQNQLIIANEGSADFEASTQIIQRTCQSMFDRYNVRLKYKNTNDNISKYIFLIKSQKDDNYFTIYCTLVTNTKTNKMQYIFAMSNSNNQDDLLYIARSLTLI